MKLTLIVFIAHCCSAQRVKVDFLASVEAPTGASALTIAVAGRNSRLPDNPADLLPANHPPLRFC